MWPSASGHLAKGHDWWLISTHPSTYAATVYIYICVCVCVCVLYTYTVNTCIKRQGTTSSCHTCNYTHLLGWTHTQRKHVHHVGELLVQNATVTECSHVASRLCQTSLPKNLKNSAFGTSTNHLAKRKTRQAHSHEGNSSGQVLGFFLNLVLYFGRFVLRLWSLPFKLQRMSKKFHLWKDKSKRQSKFQKTPWLKQNSWQPRGTDLKAKHQKQKKQIRCNSFKWPNYSCWRLV